MQNNAVVLKAQKLSNYFLKEHTIDTFPKREIVLITASPILSLLN